MTRLIGVLTTAFATMVVTAGVALAQSYPPEPKPTTSVLGEGGSQGGAAFTGGDISGVAIAAVALLALGLVALFVARRRSARAAAV
jgi:hypothetical protein